MPGTGGAIEVGPVSVTALADAGTTEKVVLTLVGINTDAVRRTIELHGVVNITTGTSATAATVRIRRGTTITGTQVGTDITTPAAAGVRTAIPVEGFDSPGELVNGSYVVTVVEVGAAANGTVNYAVVGGIIG